MSSEPGWSPGPSRTAAEGEPSADPPAGPAAAPTGESSADPPADPAAATAYYPVAVLGGTGDQGRGLALRLAATGHPIVIGSRSADRAATAAAEVSADVSGLAGAGIAGTVSGAANDVAAAQATVVIVAVPYEGHAALLASLREVLHDKIVVDCVNPLGFDQRGAFALSVPEGSAAEQAAALLPDSRVVAAFHHVSAVLLMDPSITRVDTDVLVLGDERAATDEVIALAATVPGMRGVYAGRLRNAHQVEALTANLISVNRRYKAHAGIRVTDV